MAATAGCGGGDSNKLLLYSHWMSSCTCRVRFALNLKGIEYEQKTPFILGDRFGPEYLKINPMGLVPALVDGDFVISDSFAILMYLEDKFPQHPLLPIDLQRKAINFQAANIISANIQPLQNISVSRYIAEKFGPDEKLRWTQAHILKGFDALESLLKDYAGKYATGDELYLADVFLAPQIHAAVKRFSVDMNEYPLLLKMYEAYKELIAFQDAMPENQPGAPAEA
ncbi:glutathione S-transferase zeta class-like isoform X1 [Ipomoea triloba]|uniref:glutathione S-transferase zeta class-like isoform X1 n=1 Tax=Ipomoea triloba TaxID=35885 RepID=UPI00125D795C|nr:glutathione S-transferase zeta class-like isoform X1 [Ipomoea triloba]